MRFSGSLKRSGNTFPAVMIAFLAGLIVAAVAAPNYGDAANSAAPSPARVQAGDTQGVAGASRDALGDALSGTSSGGGDSGAGRQAAGTGSKASGAPGAQVANNTFRGVSKNAVRIGVATLDSNGGVEATICPKCANRAAGQGAVQEALLKAWRRDGLLPVNGRDIIPITKSYSVISAEEIRSACVELADSDILAVLEINFEVASCLASEFHIPAVVWAIASEKTLTEFNGYLHIMDMSLERGADNFAHFLQDNGLLGADHVIGAYASEAYIQVLEAALAKLNKKLKVKVVYNQSDPASSDPVAVQQFRSGEANVAIIPWAITEPRGFQDIAESQGYRPKYPTASPGVDALAQISYNYDAQDGNLVMDRPYFGYTQRTPPKVASPEAQYCLDEYQKYSGETLDAYEHAVEIRFVIAVCELLEIVRQAMINAGSQLTDQTLIQGIQAIQNLRTSYHPSMTFNGRFDGLDTYSTQQFKADGSCQPVPLVFCELKGYKRLWVQ